MPALIRRFRSGRNRRAALSVKSLSQKGRASLKRITHPNLFLSAITLLPVLVGGFAFSERLEPARLEAGRLASLGIAGAGLGIGQVTISGLRDTREGDVLDYLAVTPTTSLLGFDIEAARDRVIALPWVGDASVRRVYPSTLVVDVSEHAPFARMFNQGRVHLVTVDGVEITDEISSVHAALPLVVGEDAPAQASQFFRRLAAEPTVLRNAVALERVGARRWTLHMHEDVQVHLPESGEDEALSTLALLIRDQAVLDRAVTVIDLRLPDRLTVRLSDGAAETMSADEAAALRGAEGA